MIKRIRKFLRPMVTLGLRPGQTTDEQKRIILLNRLT
jgi:hypothetical protein